MKAIRIHEHGTADALLYEEVPLPEPGPGEVRVKLAAAGVNYIDTYHRAGAYEQALPFTPGMEGGGTVNAVGEDVTSLVPGETVAYAMNSGSYAEYVIVPAWKLVRVPDKLDIERATAVMLQGMTAHYLVDSTYPVREGDVALVHAAAGGVGLLLVQMAKMRGAHVIGTTSTEEKAELARENGADEVILYTETDFQEAVTDLTDGHGVHVVYDGVGRDTFLKGLDCLRPRGYMVLYGQASGPVDPIDPQLLNRKGSLFLARPSLGHYAATHEEIEWRADDLFEWISAGRLNVRIDREFSLGEAAAAHNYIEGRKTKGKLLLIPEHELEPETPEGTINSEDEVDQAGWDSFPASDPPSY